jgi:hypothetical protein
VVVRVYSATWMFDRNWELRTRVKLGSHLSQPAFEYCSMVGRHIGEGKAHSEPSLRINHFRIGLKNATVPANSQRDQHAFGKWI